MLKRTLMFALLLAVPLLAVPLMAVDAPSADEPIGVFANSNTNSIQFINPLTQQVSPPRLTRRLGTTGGGLFDLVITPDGKTAIVSNFGDSRIFFIDISGGFSRNPILLGSTRTPMFAEDLALSPDGKYVLVSDGGFSPLVVVVRVSTRRIVSTFDGTSKSVQAQSVQVADDGTVIVADYWNTGLHTLSLSDAGVLRYKKSYLWPPHPDYANRPLNSATSPDGQTVIAVGIEQVRPFLKTGAVLTKRQQIVLPAMGGQSCVFSQDGTKAYYVTGGGGFNGINEGTGGQVHVLNVDGPGRVSYSGIHIKFRAAGPNSQLFGVDTAAIEPSGQFLYLTNISLSGAYQSVAVVDLIRNKVVGKLPAHGLPTGIAFTTIHH
jgi:DNA-binding beta-propeller fold protein YncE